MRLQSHRRIARPIVLLLSTALVAGAAASASAHGLGKDHPKASQAQSAVFYVSPGGTAGAADRNCSSAGFSTIQAAVDAASGGSTVIVCQGTYTEDVIISTPLTLKGKTGAVVHGSPTANGNCDQLGPTGPGSAPCLAGITIKSSNVTVQHLTVTGAIGEGILATGSLAGGSISHVVIVDNDVVGNDTGGIPPNTTSPYPQCVEFGEVPGDCGEGIHLMGAADSKVSNNFVSGNTGGVLLTDEFGPTHDNVILNNNITKNQFDCGVTAPGHNPFALNSRGNRQPSVAGVYNNVIRDNKITQNGQLGEGAGVLFANATAGTASYNNLVENNYIVGNELSGVTMHAHPIGPGQFEDLNGNRIIHNTIGPNNTGGDPDAGDTHTTGILVYSGTVPVKVTISHNKIRSNHFGIWLGVGGLVTANIQVNGFQNVRTPVFTSP
jgi:parallel beta-helix repeat protein